MTEAKPGSGYWVFFPPFLFFDWMRMGKNDLKRCECKRVPPCRLYARLFNFRRERCGESGPNKTYIGLCVPCNVCELRRYVWCEMCVVGMQWRDVDAVVGSSGGMWWQDVL